MNVIAVLVMGLRPCHTFTRCSEHATCCCSQCLCSCIPSTLFLALSVLLHSSLSRPAAGAQGTSESGAHLSCQGHSSRLIAATR